MSNFLERPNQFHQTHPQPGQAAPKSSGCSIAVIVISIVGVLGLLGCGCCGGLLYWGMELDTQQMADAVRDDPNVQQELGGIEKISYNWIKTGEADNETFVYDVQGPKGKGTLYIEDDWSEIKSARLETEKGQWELEVQQLDLDFAD